MPGVPSTRAVRRGVKLIDDACLMVGKGGFTKLSKWKVKKVEGRMGDIHEHIKGEKGSSKLDLFSDDKGDIYIMPKDGSGPGEPIGLNVRDLTGEGNE